MNKGGPPRSSRRPSPKTLVERAERQQQAIDLATQGLSYAGIAAAMGNKSKSTAHELLHKALRANVSEAIETYRRVEDQRIEALMSVYMPLAMTGDLDAAKYVDTLIGRRAKLMGANAPERAPVDANGNTVGGEVDVVEVLAGRIARLAAKRAAGDGPGEPDNG